MAGSSFVPAPGGGKEYPGNLTSYVLVTCIIAAMGGLIFGYDIGISGGVTSMDSFLKKFFPSVYRKQQADGSTNQYCKFDSQTLTMFTSSLYLAALLSSIVASTVTRRFGRKLSMLFGGVLFCVGALINGLAQAVWMLILGRILLGFGIGFANQAVPLYLSEMAPYKFRGALNIGFQLSITIGILAANVLNGNAVHPDDRVSDSENGEGEGDNRGGLDEEDSGEDDAAFEQPSAAAGCGCRRRFVVAGGEAAI